MSRLINFYSGIGTDHAGRTINHILAFDSGKLESTHDYIQWIFPNRIPSAYNPEAPLLTDKDVKQFKYSPDLLAKVKQAFEMMTNFYEISAGPPYWWDTKHNHNWLRMTRILLFLKEVGFTKQAESFLRHINKASLPDPKTRTFWSDAIR
jgi:hypothetical protein